MSLLVRLWLTWIQQPRQEQIFITVRAATEPPNSHQAPGLLTRLSPTSSGLFHRLSFLKIRWKDFRITVVFLWSTGRTSSDSSTRRETSPSWRARWRRGTSSTTSSIATAPQTSQRTSTACCQLCPPWSTSTTGAVPSWATLESCWTAAADLRSTRMTSSSGRVSVGVCQIGVFDAVGYVEPLRGDSGSSQSVTPQGRSVCVTVWVEVSVLLIHVSLFKAASEFKVTSNPESWVMRTKRAPFPVNNTRPVPVTLV